MQILTRTGRWSTIM